MKRPSSRGAVLVGFMGSGKSVVGKELARRLGARFADTDARIEEMAGATVPEIFAARGETAFRELERDAIRDLVSVPGRVIATGGGAFLDEENRRLLSAYAPVIHLEASPGTVLSRLAGDAGRPLLAGPDRERTVRELHARRAASYREADFSVRTDALSVEEVADRIVRILSGKEGEGE